MPYSKWQSLTVPALGFTVAFKVAEVCDQFLSHAERHNEPKTFTWYKKFLQSFCDFNSNLQQFRERQHTPAQAFRKRFAVGRACGNAVRAPEATMVSKEGPLAPLRRIR